MAFIPMSKDRNQHPPQTCVKAGIIGAAGYAGGELIRLLIGHPMAEIVFAHSESNQGKRIEEVHEGLFGETSLCFTSDLPLDAVDVIFLCMGHGRSAEFLQRHALPDSLRVIDLSQDFRLGGEQGFVYGLPELHRQTIAGCRRVANPGCFATCIQLALLPALRGGLIRGDIHVNGITGSTGAGQKPSATTHFSWRNDNISVYKVFTHQHLLEINQTIQEVSPGYEGRVRFIPQRGCFSRGIFVTAYAASDASDAEARACYRSFYAGTPLTFTTDSMPDLKQVVNTSKALVYAGKHDDQLLMVACIDNLLKGAAGQAVENMNLMFGLDEAMGLRLKASAF